MTTTDLAFDTTPRAYAKAARQPRKQQGAGSCRTKCSGGYACVCTAKYAHKIHCCKNLDCVCRLDLRESGSGVKE
jgi:hypothetical protein